MRDETGKKKKKRKCLQRKKWKSLSWTFKNKGKNITGRDEGREEEKEEEGKK